MSWLDRWRRRKGEAAPAVGPAPDLLAARGREPRRIAPERLTTLNVEQFLREHPRAVVDVWAPWCGPCRAFAPIFASAAADWGTEVGFGKLHADHEPSLVRRFKVRALPSLLFFRDGRQVRLEVGVVSEERFVAQLHLAFRDLPAEPPARR